MANQTGANPYVFDTTTGASISGPFKLRLIQWVDVGGDMTDNDDLAMTINGVSLDTKVQRPTDAGFAPGAVFWEIGPFNPGMSVHDFSVDTLDSGAVHVWID